METARGGGELLAHNDREQTANEIGLLASEVERRDAAVAVLLRRLADAVRQRKHEEARGYASVIDPRAIAELLVDRRSLVWGLLEVARNILVFAPIAVTWYGLSTASDAYARTLAERPELMSRPFLLLWQENFAGAHVLNFSTVATIDASLIGLLIVLSFLVHIRADVRGAAQRARALLKESQIRVLLGHAASLSSRAGLGEAESDELLDEMAAEERRIYERAVEREERLLDLEVAVSELRAAAADLARAADAMSEREPARERLHRDPVR